MWVACHGGGGGGWMAGPSEQGAKGDRRTWPPLESCLLSNFHYCRPGRRRCRVLTIRVTFLVVLERTFWFSLLQRL
jgi:hypothetical protein